MASGKDESADGPDPQQGSESEFGPSLSEFGPSLTGFGPAPEPGAQGWTPAPPPAQIPDLAWRPADAAPPIPAPPPEYRAPESWTPPATGQFPVVGPESGVDPTEETVRLGAQERPVSNGWARAGGIKPVAGRPSVVGQSRPPAAKPAGAPQGESLDWADDPIGQWLAPKGAAKPKTAPPQEESERSWKKFAMIGGAAAVVLVAIGAGVVAMTGGDSDPEPEVALPLGTTSTASRSVSASPSTTAALSCPARREGNLSIGNGPGGTASGVEAILGFQHAFYADRNGAKARSFVAPDAANVSTAEVIQKDGIDPTPAGTSYCLRIVELAPESYDADLTVHRPDGTTSVYQQHVTTVDRDGKHLIFAIDER
ncbi:hypothetical protein [Nocardia jejuensis]|uniref:hypothetical protein n=1 Tax=Nocardia jejuensis TaxID=328049 RepID=UPI000835ABC2|nr:hypothetical protein [Nocardia jejuensis]